MSMYGTRGFRPSRNPWRVETPEVQEETTEVQEDTRVAFLPEGYITLSPESFTVTWFKDIKRLNREDTPLYDTVLLHFLEWAEGEKI